MRHQLKTLPSFFAALYSGEKTFEIRKNDRNFQVGDELDLLEWDGTDYTGGQIIVRITYITDFMQKTGYVVLGIAQT